MATGELLCLLIGRTFSCSFFVVISHWRINVFPSHLNHPKDLPAGNSAFATGTARNHCVYICGGVYMDLLGTSALGRHFPSWFPGDHKGGQKGKNSHPNSPPAREVYELCCFNFPIYVNANDNFGFCMNWSFEFSHVVVATFPSQPQNIERFCFYRCGTDGTCSENEKVWKKIMAVLLAWLFFL